ncbi:MAG: AarF/UbiB family protein, partial [Myxococcota bacterium]
MHDSVWYMHRSVLGACLTGGVLMSGLRGIGQAWQDVGRLRQILAILVRHGFGELVARLHLQENIVGQILGLKPEVEEQMSTAKRLTLAMQELGTTFIKLGQILSTRPDLIPQEYTVELKTLQTQASPLPFEVIRAQIEDSLKAPLEELFASFSEIPLASASIAQVHTATLEDGSDVVVKVARPGIRESMVSDLSILKGLARRATQLIADIALFDPVGMVEEFERGLLKELDFQNELRNIRRFRNNFQDDPRVHIPKPYPQYRHKNILVMERIRGVIITEAQGQREQIVENTLHAVCEMVFAHGFFHGDLHPGNMIIEEDLSIALIDFGLVG